MGLLDVLTGIQNGPRGQRQPTSGSGGMSPIMMALLGLLAYKALKGRMGQATGARGIDAPAPAQQQGGGIGDILGGLFGGLSRGASPTDTTPGGARDALGGPQAGSILSDGLRNLIRGFQDSGHGGTAQSWVGTGQNEEIAPDSLAQALGSDTLDALSQRTGMARGDLLEALRQQLPELVDKLTPEGRLPTEEEASRMV